MPNITPPPIIACARVICFALVDDDVHFTGSCEIVVDGKALGPVKRLAICTNPIGNALLSLYCDEDWNCLAAAGHVSIEKAKASVERAYSGITNKWQDSSSDDAGGVLHHQEHLPACSFCGKRGFEVANFIDGHDARICNRCVEHFHLMLNTQDA